MYSYCKKLLFLVLVSLTFHFPAIARQYDELHLVKGIDTKVYYSTGHEQRAKDIANRIENASAYNYKLLGFKADVMVLVLSNDDWSKHTSFPVYGMPHYTNNKTLIIAASDNDFWKSFLPTLEKLPASLAEQIKKAYIVNDRQLSMQPFFDLLAIHELGHAFHIQGGLTMQRKWMGELFCNLLLHTYIAGREPGLLPALTAFPEMVVSAGTQGFSFTTLDELEKNYELIATQHPKNYGWYQSRLHVAAKNIYNRGGKEVLVKLWKALGSTSEKMNDKQFASLLKRKVNKSVADVMLKW